MPETTDRLRNLVADELGGCCDGDLTARLAALDDLKERASGERAADDLPILSALAGETRYRLVRLLAAAEGELCVCELLPLMDVSESAVSHALSELAAAGLVERRKDGKWRYYATTDRAEALLAALDAGRSAPRNDRAGDARENAERGADDESGGASP